MGTIIQTAETFTIQPVFQRIYEIRGQKVMLDFDLAELYGVETKVLNQAVKRNLRRFPEDFMFQLTKKEDIMILRSQIVTLRSQSSEDEAKSPRTEHGRHKKYPPYAFTEQGIAMLSSVLRSERAIDVNIAIMRAFVALRQYALNYADLSNRLEELAQTTDSNFSEVFSILDELIAQKKLYENRKPIGFVVRDEEK
ncbi:MAG: ORF6N domain-containing protein [Bacteroidales bacterium]|nr:ORF6N domain-containing protein [Bacteroidales bacterium]